jgi:hypothetical protein
MDLSGKFMTRFFRFGAASGFFLRRRTFGVPDPFFLAQGWQKRLEKQLEDSAAFPGVL